MGKCSVPFCKGNATFTFPRDEKRRILWENAIGPNFRSLKSSRLCPNHFEKDLIIQNNESYYTGVKSSKKTLKPNAVATLMLKLEILKSKRSEKIRKALFEEDSNSSLSLSLLDDSLQSAKDGYRNSETISKEAPVKNYSSLSLTSHIDEINVVDQEITVTDVCFQEDIDDNSTEKLILSPKISDRAIKFTNLLNVPDLHSHLGIQAEETVISLMPENDRNGTVMNESTHLKLPVLKQESPVHKIKQFRSRGVQATRGFLSVSSIRFRDEAIHYYTGLETYAKFEFLYGTLIDYVDHIKYVEGQVNCLEPEDMFLLTLMKLRRNIPDFGLSFYFGISETVVANVFKTWIHFIHHLWPLLDTWPSREVVDFYMPQGFRICIHQQVIIDATEIPIDKPSNPVAQQASFTTYKNKNTVKVLVGGTPDGILCCHLTAYGGNTSDRQIVERSNLVQKCQKGDSVMADRGFNVQDMFQSHGVTINIPKFLNGKQLPSVTVLTDRKLASKWVHIERIIGLTKTYKILQEPLNFSYSRLATKIFSVCFML